ncbi:hypothetical protein [Salinivibrio kushneri]|nr:hypothetical protein [Salinivibrio kushneri]
MAFAQAPRKKKRLRKEQMTSAIANVCQGHYVSAAALAVILDRDQQSIRQQYLKAMVDNEQLGLAFPQYKNHPRQGYTSLVQED